MESYDPDDECAYVEDLLNGKSSANKTKVNWRDVDPSRVSFSVNAGRTEAKRRYDVEVEALMASLKRLCNKQNLTKDDLASLLFGETGPVVQSLKTIFETNDLKEIYGFLAMYVGQCLLGKTTKELFESMDHFSMARSKFPLKKDEYERLWEKIANYGKVPEGEATMAGRRKRNAWQLFQNNINDFLRSLCVEGTSHDLSMVTDDDKIWGDNTGQNAVDRFLLALVRFISENRTGIVAHTVATTALNIPVNLQFQTVNDSAQTCNDRGMKFLFGENLSGNVDDANVEQLTDRGYTRLNDVIASLKQGRDRLGTVARSREWPITYDQKIRGKDDRLLLSTSGAPCLVIKEAKIGNKRLTIAAFKNGTNSCSMAISSKYHEHMWDGIPRDNNSKQPERSDYVELLQLRNQRFPFSGTAKELLLNHMESNVQVITIKQGSSDWHLLRKFSFTSSQSWASFSSLFPFRYKDEDLQDDYTRVAKVTRGPDWESLSLKPHQCSNETPIDLEKEEDRFKEYCDRQDAAFTLVAGNSITGFGDYYLQIFQKFIDTDIRMEKPQERSEYEKYVPEDENLVNEMLRLLCDRVSSDTRSIANMDLKKKQKLLEQFLLEDNFRRSLMFYSKEKLIVTLSIYKIPYDKKNKEETLIKKIHQHIIEKRNSKKLPNTGYEAIERLNIIQILRTSFQQRFTGDKRAACEMGHRNEPIILHEFVKEVELGLLNRFNIDCVEGIFTTGLVAVKGKEYIKDSIDAVIVVRNKDGEQEIWGCEVKTRTCTNTMSEEVQYQRDVNGVDGTTTRKYTLDSCDELYRKVKKVSERCQMIHHSMVYNLEKILFLVGDMNGKVIHGNIITFSQETRDSYKAVLDDMYKIALSSFYDYENENRETNESCLNKIAEVAVEKDHVGSENEFYSVYFLWKEISTSGDLPYPPLHRIIPLIHSLWNTGKSGSDVTTALLESTRFQHPHVNLQSRAVYRLIGIALVTVHRCFQALTTTPENHQTLLQIQNAAASRQSYPQTLREIHNYILAKIQDLSSRIIMHQIMHPPFVSPPRVQLPRRSSRLNHGLRDYGFPRTYETPERSLKRFKREPTDLDTEFDDRVADCAANGGHPVIVVTHDCTRYPGKCSICQTATAVMCIKCHKWFCFKTVKEENANEGTKFYYIESIKHKRDEEKVFYTCVETCYDKMHRVRYREDDA